MNEIASTAPALDTSAETVAPAEAVASAAPSDAAFPIIGVGTSAGGLDALERFFSKVPATCGYAFVVVQHLDPTQKELLVELLQRCTPLPVVEITDELTVERDHIYVIPPNCDISIDHGMLQILDPQVRRGLRLPIDGFLRRLAEDREALSIGVILSGMGSDGTVGARVIKEHAGAVFVQSPDTAQFSSMPQSAVDAGLADVVAPANELYGAIVRHLSAAPQLTDDSARPGDEVSADVARVVALLRTQTGHDFSHYKSSTVTRRVQRRMGVHHLATVAAYEAYVRANPAEGELLFKELLIGRRIRSRSRSSKRSNRSRRRPRSRCSCLRPISTKTPSTRHALASSRWASRPTSRMRVSSVSSQRKSAAIASRNAFAK